MDRAQDDLYSLLGGAASGMEAPIGDPKIPCVPPPQQCTALRHPPRRHQMRMPNNLPSPCPDGAARTCAQGADDGHDDHGRGV